MFSCVLVYSSHTTVKFQKVASELELKKRRELQRNEFQPPKTESEDETDDELEDEVDLTK